MANFLGCTFAAAAGEVTDALDGRRVSGPGLLRLTFHKTHLGDG